MKPTGETLFIGTVAIAAAAALAADAAVFDHGPRVLAFPGTVAAAMVAMIALRLYRVAQADAGGAEKVVSGDEGVSRVAMLWMAGAFCAIVVFGAAIALPAVALAYARHRGAGWTAAITLSLLVFALVSGLFGLILGKPMPSLLGPV